MALLDWEQISDNLPEFGEHLTGSLYLSGSFNVSGSIFLNDIDIETLIADSDIFQPTGSYYATTNDLQITGSMFIELDALQDSFTVNKSGVKKLEINPEGILTIGVNSSEPTPVTGGIYFSGDNNFYFGFDN